MSSICVSGQGQRIHLGEEIGEGAVGTIFRVVGAKDQVAKIYKPGADLNEYAAKIAAMVARPPRLPNIKAGRQECVQLAWPTDTLCNASGEFVGFLMPEIDLKRSSVLESVMNQKTRDVDKISHFYGYRVLLAANLAALMASLHGLGHYMIDMKPENLRFYPGEWYMALLDADGFNIQGDSRRFASRQFSFDYIAPEARGRGPESLGLEQDLFALAVIIFRLLNNGIHPYQFAPKSGKLLPTSNQERIFEHLYPYGLLAHTDIAPSPVSIHTSFEPETRRLFDRAFAGMGPRPRSDEWRDHLTSLLGKRGAFRRCKRDRDHGHFSGVCGFCKRDKLLATPLSATPSIAIKPQVAKSALGPVFTAPAPKPPRAVPPSRPPPPSPVSVAVAPAPVTKGRPALVFWSVVFAVILAWSAFSAGQSSRGAPNAVTPPPSPNAPQAAAPPSPRFPTSFNCGKPAGPVEATICGNEGLAEADRSVIAMYWAARRQSPRDVPLLRERQRSWLLERSACAATADIEKCVRSAYETRGGELRQALDSGGGSASIDATVLVEPKPSAAAHVLTGVAFDQEPSAADLATFYPEGAQRLNGMGSATIRCGVTSLGIAASCSVLAEAPTGLGLGDAAVRLASAFRLRPAKVDGVPIDGGQFLVRINFAPTIG